MGRPTTYKPEYCERAIELGAQGYSKAEIAADLCGGSYQQLDAWGKANPAFVEALTRARTLALAYFEAMARKNAGNREFNSNLYRILMGGRFQAEYREGRNVDVTVTPATVDVSLLTSEERAKLAELLGKAKRPAPITAPIDATQSAKLLIDNAD